MLFIGKAITPYEIANIYTFKLVSTNKGNAAQSRKINKGNAA